MKDKKNSLSYQKRKSLSGFLFCLPFCIGFLVFFAAPAVSSIRYAFSTIIFEKTGLKLTYVGLKNFKEALFADPLFLRAIVSSMQSMALQIPVILVFSLFAALMLNQKFKGRVIFRAAFFLPVIVVSGNVLKILQADYLSSQIMNGAQSGSLFGFSLEEAGILGMVGLPLPIAQFITNVSYNIFSITWNSGVQILIFLAGLQTVPTALHECAKIEGATAWEYFWKITFPLLSPVVVMNIIYSAADYFTTSVNPVIQLVAQQQAQMKFEYAAGLSWMYLIAVAVILVVVYAIVNKRVVYINEEAR